MECEKKKIENVRRTSSQGLDSRYEKTRRAWPVNGGHFLGTPGIPVDRMLWEWLMRKAIVRKAVRHDGEHIEVIPISLLVAELNGVSAGLLISSPEIPGDRTCIEMYMLAVARFARRQGIAASLVEHEERQYSTGTSFYARCYKKSTWAIELFRKLGYRIERVSENTGMHYLRKSAK